MDNNITIKEPKFSNRWWRSWGYITVGCILLAAGYVLFMTPYKIIPGGVYGLGIIFNYIFPSFQVGTYGLMFDIPLLLISFKVFGGQVGIRTVYAALITPLIMNAMTLIVGSDPAIMFNGHINLTDDKMVASIFGGVMIGAGVGFIIKTGATSGGTDIVSMIVSKYCNMMFSRAVLIVESVVVVFGIIILGDWKLPLYSLITIFVSARMIDYVIDGATYDKLLFVVTPKHEQLKRFILEDMGRGATYIKSSGMFTGEDKEMIFLVVSRREISMVQNKILQIDPDAFLTVVDAYETFGDGFKSIAEEQQVS